MKVKAALCVRTNLSPDADSLSSPLRMANALVESGIKIVALTDLNTSLNAPAFCINCATLPLVPIFGLEAVSAEGYSVFCLFSNLRKAVDFGSAWYRTLGNLCPKRPQLVVDEAGCIIDSLDTDLLQKSCVEAKRLVRAARMLGGICFCTDDAVAKELNLPFVNTARILLLDGIRSDSIIELDIPEPFGSTAEEAFEAVRLALARCAGLP